jgi:hypothetical protein
MLLNNDLLLNTYRRYLEVSKGDPDHDRYADYGWEALPEKLNAGWLAYGLMLPEFSRSLANIVNQLGNYARRLIIWDKVLIDFDEDLKLELLLEFVDHIATISLNLLYAIQCRFAFAVAHLSHQANKCKLGREWKDDLPDDKKIKLKTTKKYARGWSSFANLEGSLSAIFSDQHQRDTDQFRDKFTHRVPTQVVLGHSTFVRRGKDLKGRGVEYEFGHRPPINIKLLGNELVGEFHRSLVAFQDFKMLVAEQSEAIRSNNTLP